MQQQRLRFRERLALFEQKNKLAPVLVRNRFVFLQNRLGCRKMSHRLPENEQPALGKSATDFVKMSHRFWGNEPPTFGKMSHRLWENQRPTSGKWATAYGKISHRLRGNQPPTLGKWATGFGKISDRLRENQPPTLGKNEPPILGKWASATRGNSKQIISKKN